MKKENPRKGDEEMSEPLFRPLSKPKGFDRRTRRELTRGYDVARAEAPSLVAARSHAERLGVPLEEVMPEERRRLLASSYPGSECFEPYEVEEYAAGALSVARAQHIENCEGCRVLVSSVAPSQGEVAAFLDRVRETEPEPETLTLAARGFRFDLVAAPAAAVVVGGIGYFSLQLLGSVTKDPSVRSAVLTQVTGLLHPGVVIILVVASLLGITSLLWRYGSTVWRTSGGAVIAGVGLGLFAIFMGGKNVADSVNAARAVLKLQQVQLTETLATSLGQDALTSSSKGFDAMKLHIESSSLVKVAASQPAADRLVFESSVEGLPGTMLAELQANGGQLYWDYGGEKQPLDQLLFGTVESSSTYEFVLISPDQNKHVIKSVAGYALGKGSKVMVLVNPKDQNAISVRPLIAWDPTNM